MRFILDANLSPKTAEYLQDNFSFNVSSLIGEKLGNLNDDEVLEKAKKEKRIIITLDLDFGKLYHDLQPEPNFGVIIIRTNDQRRNHIELLLHKFFTAEVSQKTFSTNSNKLVIIEDALIRTS